MTTYLVTGATGFLGRRLVGRLLARPDARVLALVRPASRRQLAELAGHWPAAGRLKPLTGDLTRDGLGLPASRVRQLTGQVDHVVHLAALYDITADKPANRAANVDGTRRVVELANRVAAGCLHHVSSVAVAGGHPGVFREDMFDEGQPLPSPYHATKFDAERLVRGEARVPWRVYRPGIVVGDSQTGEMDKVDGPYYFFPAIARLAALPSWLPSVGPDLGDTNVVPVDYVTAAMDHLMHQPGLDGRAFHLVSPRPQPVVEVYNAFARVAGAPTVLLGVPRRLLGPARAAAGLLGRAEAVSALRDLALTRLGIPPEVLPHLSFRPVFDSTATEAALAGSGLQVPRLDDYAAALWAYWRGHLDPDRARRSRPGGPLAGRRVVITGASSGIGRATALQVAAAGGLPLLVARRAEALAQVRVQIERAGGQAWVYPCDLTIQDQVDQLVKQLHADHDGVDMLVNNAGRSIRRSVRLSYERMHDYERTITLNYLAGVRLLLGLLPQMTEQRFGHVVNVSSIGVQANPPRFSAYVASKAALDAFSRVVATETFGEGVTFTTIHMPLVRTPMIQPTRIYDAFPAITPENAAALVLRALIERPKHIGTPLGTLAEVSYALAPRAVDAVLHEAYRVFPDSKAAGGRDRLDPNSPEARLSRSALAMIRLLPGVHW